MPGLHGTPLRILRVPFADAIALQKKLFAGMKAGSAPAKWVKIAKWYRLLRNAGCKGIREKAKGKAFQLPGAFPCPLLQPPNRQERSSAESGGVAASADGRSSTNAAPVPGPSLCVVIVPFISFAASALACRPNP